LARFGRGCVVQSRACIWSGSRVLPGACRRDLTAIPIPLPCEFCMIVSNGVRAIGTGSGGPHSTPLYSLSKAAMPSKVLWHGPCGWPVDDALEPRRNTHSLLSLAARHVQFERHVIRVFRGREVRKGLMRDHSVSSGSAVSPGNHKMSTCFVRRAKGLRGVVRW